MTFGGKIQERKVSEDVKEKYKVSRNTRSFLVHEINDPTVQMGTMILTYKMMRKSMPKEVSANVIALAGLYDKGV